MDSRMLFRNYTEAIIKNISEGNEVRAKENFTELVKVFNGFENLLNHQDFKEYKIFILELKEYLFNDIWKDLTGKDQAKAMLFDSYKEDIKKQEAR